MRTLLEYGLANVLMATLLALLVVALSTVVKRPAVRNLLWVLVLIRFVLPPVFRVPLPSWADAPPVEVAAQSEAAVVEPTPQPLDDLGWDEGVFAFPFDELPVAVVHAEPIVVPEAVPMPPRFDPWAIASWWLGGIWLAGTVFVFVQAFWRVRRFRHALRDAVSAPESLQVQTRALADTMGLRHAPEVRLVPGKMWPALWQPGWRQRQALILLPEGLLALLDPAQRAAVLAHELAHLRRGDPWVRWLELTVNALYWWYPVLRWIRRQMHASEEACCDMWVVAALAGRRAYATALVETVSYLSNSATPTPALASGAGPVDDLQRRVTMIMSAQWPAKLTRWGLAAVLGLGTVGLAFGPALAQPPADKERPKERPRDGDNPPKERPRDGDNPRPKDKERPRDGDPRPKEGPRDGDPRPKEGPRKGEPPNPDDVAKAREAVEKARKEFQSAMEKMMEAEQRLARLEGRPARGFGGAAGGGAFPGFPGGFPGRGGDGGRGAGGVPGGPGGVGGGPGVPGVMPGTPGGPGGPGGVGGGLGRPMGEGPGRMPDFRELQQQLDEMRKALEEMRREMRRQNGERPPEGGRPTERPGDRPTERPGNRPAERPPERKP